MLICRALFRAPGRVGAPVPLEILAPTTGTTGDGWTSAELSFGEYAIGEKKLIFGLWGPMQLSCMDECIFLSLLIEEQPREDASGRHPFPTFIYLE
jgi:hypothetical protein